MSSFPVAVARLDPAPAAPSRPPGVIRAGLALAYLSAATIPWTGITIGTAPFGDYMLLLAFGVLVSGDMRQRLPGPPGWVWALAGAVLLTGVINQLAPPSPEYLMIRNIPVGDAVTRVVTTPLTNLIVMIPLVGRVLVLPFVFTLARLHDPRAVRRAALAFLGGAAISSLIAYTDSRGLTSIGPRFTHVDVATARAAGLTKHPNVVAMGCVCALPIAVWQASAARARRRVWAVAALIALLLGLYASRSRSGAIAAGVAGLVALAWLPQYRRHLASVTFLVVAVTAAVFAANPALGASLLSHLRFTGGDAAGSDHIRSLINHQAWGDFTHSPLHGIGLEVADTAHVIYLQALAVGGLLLLTGLVAYQIGSLSRCARMARGNPLAITLFVAILGEIIFNSEQNALTISLAYIVPSLAAAMPLHSDDAGDEVAEPAGVSRSVGRPVAPELIDT